MEEDFFLKKMKGVKPIKNKEDILKLRQKTKKTTPNKILKKDKVINNNNIFIEQENNPSYTMSFGDINKELKKGKIKIDRRIDLHGYGLLEAEEKLKNEVVKNYNRNKRCLLFVTGKGINPKNNKSEFSEKKSPKLFHGKIKNSIIAWVENNQLKKYILTYQVAGAEHGGDGALFVYLRKKKI